MTLSPLRVSEHVYVLPLAARLMGGPTTLFPALILDEAQGVTLVDTGIPGAQDELQGALSALGLTWRDLKRVIVTHHDLDHVGSLPAVVAASGAGVLTSAGEVPFVQGERPGQKQPTPEMLAGMPPEMAAHFTHPPSARVTQVLHDGEVLDFAGGVQVVLTPGHTEGHLSLFVRREGVLIGGDALVSAQGRLHGPLERATPNLPEAWRSVRKLAALPAARVLTYHGGLVQDDVPEQLARLAAEADAHGAPV